MAGTSKKFMPGTVVRERFLIGTIMAGTIVPKRLMPGTT